MPPSQVLPVEAVARLDALVDRIEAEPGSFVDVNEFIELQQKLDVRAAIKTLPQGLSEEDFAGILKLALLTECATETYGDAIGERARRFDARWLERFNTNVWVPDELTHHTPYKYILMNLGFSEAELDREIKAAQDAPFEHRGGDLPVQVTTFGVVQEYLTDNWHGLIAQLLKTASPEASYMATRVKRRETLHTVWYRDMTALQIEANPRLLPLVAEALIKFELPGNYVAPEFQKHATRWLPHMGADFDRITRDLVRLIYEMAGDTSRAGRLLVDIADQKGFKLGPVSPRTLRTALDRLGGPGYGLIGEALLEKMGLAYTFQPRGAGGDAAYSFYRAPFEKIRSLLRTWIAERIDIQLATDGSV
ncbi:MAG TPA: hypothetical protein VFZ12_07070 [Dehalococcoidia bacterium]|nr:hypothetical protein [Dehalococcoidia bacterium]